AFGEWNLHRERHQQEASPHGFVHGVQAWLMVAGDEELEGGVSCFVTPRLEGNKTDCSSLLPRVPPQCGTTGKSQDKTGRSGCLSAAACSAVYPLPKRLCIIGPWPGLARQ